MLSLKALTSRCAGRRRRCPQCGHSEGKFRHESALSGALDQTAQVAQGAVDGAARAWVVAARYGHQSASKFVEQDLPVEVRGLQHLPGRFALLREQLLGKSQLTTTTGLDRAAEKLSTGQGLARAVWWWYLY